MVSLQIWPKHSYRHTSIYWSSGCRIFHHTQFPKTGWPRFKRQTQPTHLVKIANSGPAASPGIVAISGCSIFWKNDLMIVSYRIGSSDKFTSAKATWVERLRGKDWWRAVYIRVLRKCLNDSVPGRSLQHRLFIFSCLLPHLHLFYSSASASWSNPPHKEGLACIDVRPTERN